MVTTYNGMPAGELGDVRWQKSQHSNPNGACVELAALPGGEIAMRNSRFPVGPVLLYTQAEITAFLAGAKDGEFDHILRRSGPAYPPVAAASRPACGGHVNNKTLAERDPQDLREHGEIRTSVELSQKPLPQA